MKKVLIIGHARHGKDSLAELLRDEFGLRFKSQAAADIFIYDMLKEKYGYKTPEECFEDRMNRRAEWFDLICDFNKDDKARLAKEIMRQADCYVGMRSSDEIAKCKEEKIFDVVVWVDASNRLPLEDKSSFNITKKDADIIIYNNGTFEEFKDRARELGKLLIQ